MKNSMDLFNLLQPALAGAAGGLQGMQLGPVPWYQALNFQSTLEFDLNKLVNFAKSSFFFKALAEKKTAYDWSGNLDGEKLILEQLCEEIQQLGYILIYKTEQNMSHLRFLSTEAAALILTKDEGNPMIYFNVITTDLELLNKIREIFDRYIKNE